jgi:HEAT repeat protein
LFGWNKKHMDNTDMGRDSAGDMEEGSPRILLRRRVRELLGSGDSEQVLRELRKISPRKTINPLISVFYDSDSELKRKAIKAFGQVVADLANEDMEAARVVMRRLMWMLNDESGGIGWGAPEAMAEAMACHPRLAEEYVRILLSYIREDGNFLEYEPLRRGALWGIGRLAQVYPEILIELEAAKYIRPYLESDDQSSRELSAWALRMLGDETDY